MKSYLQTNISFLKNFSSVLIGCRIEKFRVFKNSLSVTNQGYLMLQIA